MEKEEAVDTSHRISYLEGIIEGIRLYAIWNNGEQRRLKNVLQPLLDGVRESAFDNFSKEYDKL